MINYFYNHFKSKKQMEKLNSPCHGVPQQRPANVHARGTCWPEWWQLIPLIHIIIGQVDNIIGHSMPTTTCPSTCSCSCPSSLSTTTYNISRDTGTYNRIKNNYKLIFSWRVNRSQIDNNMILTWTNRRTRSGCTTTIECFSTRRTYIMQTIQL